MCLCLLSALKIRVRSHFRCRWYGICLSILEGRESVLETEKVAAGVVLCYFPRGYGYEQNNSRFHGISP